MGTKTLMTVEQFAQLTTSETEDFELVDGELIPLSSGTYRHNKIRDLMGHILWVYFKAHPVGEAIGENHCRVSPELVRRPDISVFLGDRWRQLDLDRIPAPYPPDIVIEVLSPTESAMDVRRKVRDYLRGGSQEVWLLDHSNGEVVVHTQANVRILAESESLETPLLPGFSLPVADLFVGC